MRAPFLVLLSVLLASCESASEPSVRRRAWLGSPPQAILAPDTVRAGVAFTVTAFAAGSGTIDCNRPDGADVAQAGGVARVEIFVRVKRGTLVCTDDLRSYPIQVSLSFPTPGVSTIRVIGVTYSEGAYPVDSLERSVVVVP
jgi:hypothetical protein